MIVSIILIYSMNKKTHSLIGKKSFGFWAGTGGGGRFHMRRCGIKYRRCSVWINTFAAVIAAIPVYFAVYTFEG